MSALAAAAGAETVPASVRACALETDSLKRLVCFDKEVARYTVQPPTSDNRPASAAPAASAPVARASAAPAPVTPAAASAAAIAQFGDPPADTPAPPKPAKLKHISAHVASIESFPDAMVVHLDNEQVWEQIQEAPAEMNLHAGDTISIDREMGSYWMSGSGGTAMKVRRRK
jgi:hypothetical protein